MASAAGLSKELESGWLAGLGPRAHSSARLRNSGPAGPSCVRTLEHRELLRMFL